MLKIRNSLLSVLLIFTLAGIMSCAETGEDGGGSEPVNSISGITFFPPDAAFLAASNGIGIQLTDSNEGFPDATYSIFLYGNRAMTHMVGKAENLKANAAGQVNWTYGRRLGHNKQYFWSFVVEYPEAASRDGSLASQSRVVQSGLLRFRIPQNGGLTARSPRNNGFMDANHAGAPKLSVANYYNAGGADIKYDFELGVNPEMTNLVSAISELAQNSAQSHTTWHIDPANFPGESDEFGIQGLLEGRRYYWRVRMNLNGNQHAWSPIYFFDVVNLCHIRGPLYATNVINWDVQRVCDVLVNVNPNQALGTQNASGHIDGVATGRGYLSLDFGGELVVEMGRPVLNGGGPDLRVFEYISTEVIEVFAGLSEVGPWFSMGSRFCGDYCDFDLGAAGLPYAKFIKIVDLNSPFARCHETSGADIDAIVALHGIISDQQCGP